MRTLHHIIVSLTFFFVYACGSEAATPAGGFQEPTDISASGGGHQGGTEPQGDFMGAADGAAGSGGPANEPDAGIGDPPDSGTSPPPPQDAGDLVDAGEPEPEPDASTDAGEPDADAGETDAGDVECFQNADCNDDIECTLDECIDHVCVNDAVATEGAECDGTGLVGGTCRAGACCKGCWDSVLGCIEDSTFNDVSCGRQGSLCITCTDTAQTPVCGSGQCCTSPSPVAQCSPLQW